MESLLQSVLDKIYAVAEAGTISYWILYLISTWALNTRLGLAIRMQKIILILLLILLTI